MIVEQEKVAGLLKVASTSLRAQEKKIKELTEKVANYEKEERIRGLASKMEEKGLNAGLDFSEKIASLREGADLNIVEAAIDLSNTDTSIGKVANLETSTDGMDAITAMLLGDD